MATCTTRTDRSPAAREALKSTERKGGTAYRHRKKNVFPAGEEFGTTTVWAIRAEMARPPKPSMTNKTTVKRCRETVTGTTYNLGTNNHLHSAVRRLQSIFSLSPCALQVVGGTPCGHCTRLASPREREALPLPPPPSSPLLSSSRLPRSPPHLPSPLPFFPLPPFPLPLPFPLSFPLLSPSPPPLLSPSPSSSPTFPFSPSPPPSPFPFFSPSPPPSPPPPLPLPLLLPHSPLSSPLHSLLYPFPLSPSPPSSPPSPFLSLSPLPPPPSLSLPPLLPSPLSPSPSSPLPSLPPLFSSSPFPLPPPSPPSPSLSPLPPSSPLSPSCPLPFPLFSPSSPLPPPLPSSPLTLISLKSGLNFPQAFLRSRDRSPPSTPRIQGPQLTLTLALTSHFLCRGALRQE
ncbi:hypothetical protein C7M84_017505 [Penaeus vannamei]|uniref:Uncharacterized protein n=1 Tax=Penaeus vannamei TaxID=6689 RepID=A0A3R7PZK3_PENVA|nr:hypothetical protein C7M84_017505 [Penaeus vannamei]